MANAPNNQRKATVNPAPTAHVAKDSDLPDFTKWSALQIGYAPYWHPEAGKKFYGEIIAKDERDPEFVRYQIRNMKSQESCRRGPNNDDTSKGAIGEEVAVPKGESFSISVYYALAEEFDYHLFYAQKTGRHVPLLVEALKTVKTKAGQDCWQWRALVSPEDKRLLDGHRDEYRRLRNGETNETDRPSLES